MTPAELCKADDLPLDEICRIIHRRKMAESRFIDYQPKWHGYYIEFWGVGLIKLKCAQIGKRVGDKIHLVKICTAYKNGVFYYTNQAHEWVEAVNL